MSKRHERERRGTMALPFHPSKRYMCLVCYWNVRCVRQNAIAIDINGRKLISLLESSFFPSFVNTEWKQDKESFTGVFFGVMVLTVRCMAG